MAVPKGTKAGAAVEVQRGVDKPWEPALYVERIQEMRGWHAAVLASTSTPRWIDSMSGYEVERGHPRAHTTWNVNVPSQRIRLRKGER